VSSDTYDYALFVFSMQLNITVFSTKPTKQQIGHQSGTSHMGQQERGERGAHRESSVRPSSRRRSSERPNRDDRQGG
jgi:hypothetical protein